MSSRSKVYTGIGSRITPADVTAKMRKIAEFLRDNHWKLRSGGADGADAAFEKGAEPHMEIYLPWKRFNGRPMEAPYYHKFEKFSQAMMIAADIHEAWHLCDQAARKLHARNVIQILGPNLDEPSKFVICWTPDGRIKGGTRTALILADRNNIPIFNLYDYAWSGAAPDAIAFMAINEDLKRHPPQ